MSGYYPGLGVVSTCNGGLYKTDPTQYSQIWNMSRQFWHTEKYHYRNTQTKLEREGKKLGLMIHNKSERAIMYFPSPRLQPVVTRLRQIQRAVRDWLYKRRSVMRLEACLALSKSGYSNDLVWMIMRPRADARGACVRA